MNKNRYVERKALCDYDLCEGLFDKLNLTVQDMIPLRKVFLLVTDKGKKILKRCDMKFEDVQFIDEALNYIYASDKDVIRYCRNKDNEVITTYNGKNYIVLDMIEGREATFTNPVEISWCTKAIEKLHVSSKGIEKYLKENNLEVAAVGKIEDIYNRKGITSAVHTKNNMDGVDKTLEYMDTVKEGLIFTNLVDFDMLYGHRNDPKGYGKALEDFDDRLQEIYSKMTDEDIFIITADHGCDPTTSSTDHSREHIPVLVYGKNVKPGVNIGTRERFSDIGKTILDFFNVNNELVGDSFFNKIME